MSVESQETAFSPCGMASRRESDGSGGSSPRSQSRWLRMDDIDAKELQRTMKLVISDAIRAMRRVIHVRLQQRWLREEFEAVADAAYAAGYAQGQVDARKVGENDNEKLG